MKIKPSDDSKWREVNGDNTFRVNYELNEKSIVVDLGARHGNWSKIIRDKYNSKIYCFEPVEKFHNELINNGFTNFRIAISDKKDTISLGIFESEASLFYTESIFFVESIPASDIFDLIKEESIDLMKINVEGAEYCILKNLIQTNSLKKIKNLQVQFHLFNNEHNNLYNEIYDMMNKTHEITWRFPFVWENWKIKN